jgi:hypothetical protein
MPCIESNALTMALSWPELARVARAPPKKSAQDAHASPSEEAGKCLLLLSMIETTAKLAAFPISINHPANFGNERKFKCLA